MRSSLRAGSHDGGRNTEGRLMFFRRHYEKEIMDDLSIRGDKLYRALYELNIINDLLGGRSVSAGALKKVIRKGESSELIVLDIGSGGSNLYRKLTTEPAGIKWIGADINPGAARYDRQHNPGKLTVCADAFALPFRRGSVHIIHTSLFLHHFSGEQITLMLNRFAEIASRAIIINDLRRNVLAFIGIKILTLLFSRSDMVKNDGPLSVKRGFVYEDIENIISALGFKKYIIRKKWAFRWQVVIFLS